MIEQKSALFTKKQWGNENQKKSMLEIVTYTLPLPAEAFSAFAD